MTTTAPTRRTNAGLGAMLMAACALLLPACEQDGFTIADTDKDGKVSPDEFNRFMMEAIYSEIDADRDKKVTFEEWTAANPDADPSKFKAPDTNKDEVITPEEAKAFFEREGTLEDLFRKMDTNKDGYLDRSENIAFKEKLEAESGTDMQKLSKAAKKA